MKKSLSVASCFVFLMAFLARPARGEVIKFFDAVATSTTVGPYDLTGFNKASLQVTSVAGSVATIVVQKRTPAKSAGADGTGAVAAGPWSTIITINNPSPTELGYDGPGIGEIQIDLAWTSGTINGVLVRSK